MTGDRNESNSLRYAFEELKFLKSFKDLQIFADKIAYKLPTLGKGLPSRKVTAVPMSIQIEPTNGCNLRCTTCPNSRATFVRGNMDLDLFKKIVDDAATIGVRRVHLFLRGEPMLHPRIFDMIAYIKSKGLSLHLTTNGSRLTPDMGAELLGAGVNSADQLTVSILGHSKERHEATMPGINHDEVISNILGLMALRKKLNVNGPVIETILNAPPENQHESEEFKSFWTGKVDHARLGDYSVEFDKYGTDEVQSVVRTTPCTGIYDRLNVFWDGQVPQCNGDIFGEIILGNMQDNSITELWHCERLQEVRRVHQEWKLEDEPMCLHCDL